MSLSNKYNVPQDTIKKMIDDGVISCSWPRYEEIYTMYQRSMIVPGAVKSKVVIEIGEKTGYSERQVRNIIDKVK